MKGGTRSSTDAVHSTWVSPTFDQAAAFRVAGHVGFDLNRPHFIKCTVGGAHHIILCFSGDWITWRQTERNPLQHWVGGIKLPSMTEIESPFDNMNDRSREVFRRVVQSYLESGDPVGSRTLTREMSEKVSAATIRNVMQDLEHLGLLDSPHISAGRVPTQIGLRMFVDGLLEVRDLDAVDRDHLQNTMSSNSDGVPALMDRVGGALSGLTQGASLVLTPKTEAPIKHIEFVSLGPDRALVVLVFADGQVENRVFTPPMGQTPSSMREAANFLNAVAEGRTVSELQRVVSGEILKRRQEIDTLAKDMVESGLALWENEGTASERLIVRGRSNLINEGGDPAELDRIKTLFDDLERKRDIAEFLELTDEGEGVRIFIGSENKLFSLSGSSLVVSPYMNADRKIIGAVGVIGPTRLNYGRIVPIVDYTAQLIGKLMADRG
jgi:heat-inducible transcriptional repressor